MKDKCTTTSELFHPVFMLESVPCKL